MVDLQYDVGTDVLAIRTCYTSDGKDLLAIAGEDSVEVLQCVSVVYGSILGHPHKQLICLELIRS